MSENNSPISSLDPAAFSAMAENALKATAALDATALMMPMSDTIAKSLQNLTIFDPTVLSQSMTNSIVNSLQNLTFPPIPPIDISPAIKAMQIASQIPWESHLAQMTKAVQRANEANNEIILQAMESAAPHLEEKQRKTCEEEIIPKLKDPQKEPMTRSDWLAVFSILLTLITWLLSLRSDPQQQQQIEQNEVIIQQNETMSQQNEIIIQQNDRLIELDEERNELIRSYTIALNEVAGILDTFAESSDSNSEDADLQQTEPLHGPEAEQNCLDKLSNTQDPTRTL